MRGAAWWRGVGSVALVVASPALTWGQETGSLAVRIQSVGVPEVSFRFATHDDVRRCGDRRSRDSWNPSHCWTGPAEITLELRDGHVTALDAEIVRESDSPPPGARSVGTVAPQEAADYLLGLVEGSRASVAEDAIGAAVMAEGVTLWPRLMGFARARALHSDVRKAATFWLGQASAHEAVAGLEGLVRDDPDTEVREAAVFALSQRDSEVAIPILMEIAQDSDSPEVRKSAFFWLAQHDDPRVLDFFERVLRGSG